MADDGWERNLPWLKRPLRPPLSWFPLNVLVTVGVLLLVLLPLFAWHHVRRLVRGGAPDAEPGGAADGSGQPGSP